MAMMMAGRVLLVCALCVLWCGAGGRCDKGTGETLHDASASDVVKDPQESPPIAQGGSHTPVLKASGIKNKTEDSDDEPLLTEDEEDEEEASSDEEDEDQDKRLQISGKKEIPPPLPPGGGGGGGGKSEAAGGKLEKQHPVEGGTQNKSEKETVDAGEAELTKQNEGIGVQPQDHQTSVQEEDTKNEERHQLTQEKEQHTNVGAAIPINPAGDHSSGQHEGNDGSNEREEKEWEEGVEGHERHRAQETEEAAHFSGVPKVDSADVQQQFQRTHAGGTLTGIKQKAGEEMDDETEEEREEQKEQNQENPPGKEQETITGANATNQINKTSGDSDGSTAVSHTTSPLLLLVVVVACAAAAAVVAA
ncbi:mucin-associated surface protein [Trypanosoma cruzi cruzi]|uniref:Mucin-associated surface protein (MASP) n=1 Tax=Trypanosoma cruzi TaxID=5693 RepID=A0A2V2VC03_TRYCR|nr:mucin-associated surface protein [Trypanosoma cruzi cruzi]PWU92608.1 Mucin-associated surface protein (MASP) [Trypanosoma cruzi]